MKAKQALIDTNVLVSAARMHGTTPATAIHLVLSMTAMLAACTIGSGGPAQAPVPEQTSRSVVQRQIAALLFDIPLADIDEPFVGANYDYNSFGEGPEAETTCTGYAGGHAGTDMQTKDVEGSATADRDVFSLTRGEVLSTDVANGRVMVGATISLVPNAELVTIGYLHLRAIVVSPGDKIAPGAKLGLQGNLGMGLAAADKTTREHVHVEVRTAAAPHGPACGAAPMDAIGSTKLGALDPQKYFAAIVRLRNARQ